MYMKSAYEPHNQATWNISNACILGFGLLSAQGNYNDKSRLFISHISCDRLMKVRFMSGKEIIPYELWMHEL